MPVKESEGDDLFRRGGQRYYEEEGGMIWDMLRVRRWWKSVPKDSSRMRSRQKHKKERAVHEQCGGRWCETSCTASRLQIAGFSPR